MSDLRQCGMMAANFPDFDLAGKRLFLDNVSGWMGVGRGHGRLLFAPLATGCSLPAHTNPTLILKQSTTPSHGV